MKNMTLSAVCLVMALLLLAGLACSSPAATSTPAPTATATARVGPVTPTPAATSAVTSAPTPASSMAINLRLGIFAAPQDMRTQAVQEWARLVGERSGGRVNIQVFDSATLLSAGNELQETGAGVADIGATISSWSAGSIPALAYDGHFPGFASADSLNKAFVEMRPLLQPEYAKFNVIELARFNSAIIHIFAKQQFFKTLDDFKGVKFRTPGGFGTEFLKLAGASVTNVPTTDIYMDVQRGTIDAFTTSSTSYLAGKFYEVAPYISLVGEYSVSISLVMNLKTWGKLPPDIQEVFQETDIETSLQQRVASGMLADEARLQQAISQYGLHAYQVPPDEIARWQQIMMPVWDNWATTNGDSCAGVAEILKKVL